MLKIKCKTSYVLIAKLENDVLKFARHLIFSITGNI